MSGNKQRWTVLRQTFRSLFIAFCAIELSNISAGLIDGLIVSRFLGSGAMAASGIAYPIFSISGILGGLFSMGIQSVCAGELGKGNISEVSRIFSAVIYLGTFISVICAGGIVFFAGKLAMVLGATGGGASLANEAAAYLKGIGIGFPALVMIPVLCTALQLDDGRKRVLKSALVYGIFNIVFDIAAVRIGLGMFGVGLSTATAQYFQLCYLLLHFRRTDRILKFVPFRIGVRELMKLLMLGRGKAVKRVGNVLKPILVNKLIIFYGGAAAMSAMAVQNSLMDFVFFLEVGLTDTTSLLISVLFGEMDDEAISEEGKLVHRYVLMLLCPVAIVLLLFAGKAAAIYIQNDGELLRVTVFAIRILAIEIPFAALIRVRIAYLEAIEKTDLTQLLMLLSILVYTILGAVVLGSVFGIRGVLCCFLASDILSLLTVWMYNVIKSGKLIPSVSDYLALPSGFHIEPWNVISLNIRNRRDITPVARQIEFFCSGHEIDRMKGYEVAVCFEELAGNIIEYGFPACKKKPGIELRVVYTEKELIMRIKDNCPMFDVERSMAKRAEITDGDPKIGLGMRILRSMAEHITYVHSLEMNNVLIRFQIQEREREIYIV